MASLIRRFLACAGLLFVSGALTPGLASEVEISHTLMEVLTAPSARRGPLNPDNILETPRMTSETALASTLQWKGLRVRTRLVNDLARERSDWRNQSRISIQEFSYEFDLPAPFRLSIGKQAESWHVGYAFHPLGFFEPELNRDDLTERYQRGKGLPMIVGGYATDKWDLSIAYSDDGNSARDGFNRGLRQWGLRLGHLSDQGLETALIVQKPISQKIGFGGSLTYVLGEALELHGALFMRQGTRRPLHAAIYEKKLDLYRNDPHQSFRKNDSKWYPRSVLGLQWTSGDLLNFALEWGHDRRGLDGAQWRHWKELVRFHGNASNLGASREAVIGNLNYDAKTLLPSGSRRDYLFMRLAKGAGDWRPEASVLFGLADQSAVITARITYAAARTWEAELFAQHSAGPSGSEFAFVPRRAMIGLGLRRYF